MKGIVLALGLVAAAGVVAAEHTGDEHGDKGTPVPVSMAPAVPDWAPAVGIVGAAVGIGALGAIVERAWVPGFRGGRGAQ